MDTVSSNDCSLAISIITMATMDFSCIWSVLDIWFLDRRPTFNKAMSSFHLRCSWSLPAGCHDDVSIATLFLAAVLLPPTQDHSLQLTGADQLVRNDMLVHISLVQQAQVNAAENQFREVVLALLNIMPNPAKDAVKDKVLHMDSQGVALQDFLQSIKGKLQEFLCVANFTAQTGETARQESRLVLLLNFWNHVANILISGFDAILHSTLTLFAPTAQSERESATKYKNIFWFSTQQKCSDSKLDSRLPATRGGIPLLSIRIHVLVTLL